MKPQIISPSIGKHNENLKQWIAALERLQVYKDLSTVIIVPTISPIHPRVVMSWFNMVTPPNQRILRMAPWNMEVGCAYTSAIQEILDDKDLRTYRYVVTLEHDMIVQPDSLVRLLACIESNPDYSAISGLYWSKGTGGMPQIYGEVTDPRINFRPQLPKETGLVECYGIGMGFAAFRLDMFKDERIEKPWFKTDIVLDDKIPHSITQDLAFWLKAAPLGYRCAVDCSLQVGHHDAEGAAGPPGTIW